MVRSAFPQDKADSDAGEIMRAAYKVYITEAHRAIADLGVNQEVTRALAPYMVYGEVVFAKTVLAALDAGITTEELRDECRNYLNGMARAIVKSLLTMARESEENDV